MSVRSGNAEDWLRRCPSPALVVDGSGRIVVVNAAMERCLRSSAADLAGKPLSERVKDPAALRRFLSGPSESRAGLAFRAGDGDERHLSLTLAKDAFAEGDLVVASDITGEQLAQQSLRRERDQYLDMISAGSDWFWEHHGGARGSIRLFRARRNADGTVTLRYVDRQWPEEVADLNYDPEAFAEWGRKLDAREPYRDHIMRVLRDDGVEQYLRVSAVPFRDETGVWRGFRGVSVDVTGQVVAERALRESETRLRRGEEHLRHAQRVSATGSIERDLQKNTVTWSDQMYRLLGLEPRSLPPERLDFPDFVPAEDRDRVQNAIERARSGKRSRPGQLRVVRSDGDIRTLYTETDIDYDTAERPIRLLSIFKDVTAQVAAEEALRRSREHLARAQRVAGTGSIEHELDTGIQTWSDEMYRVLGIERGTLSLAETNFIDFVHPDDREKVEKAVIIAKSGRSPRPGEVRMVRRGGEMRTIYIENDLDRDAAGKPVLVSVFKDVTEQRRGEARSKDMEQQLIQAQKLEALGTLAGGVAHELNNTLVPVLALAKMTVKRLPEGSREQNNLITILRAGEKARDLVERIVAFSRKEMPTRVAIDLCRLTHKTVELLRHSLPATVVLLERLEPVADIMGDPGQLPQVIINLVMNAIQALPDQAGRVTIEVAAAAGERLPQVPERGAGAAVRLSVIDTGCGMDRATLVRVFEPFFTTKQVGAGSGLGLSVVHGIVTQHGGHISVDSKPGRGTRFDVYFPALAKLAEPERAAS